MTREGREWEKGERGEGEREGKWGWKRREGAEEGQITRNEKGRGEKSNANLLFNLDFGSLRSPPSRNASLSSPWKSTLHSEEPASVSRQPTKPLPSSSSSTSPCLPTSSSAQTSPLPPRRRKHWRTTRRSHGGAWGSGGCRGGLGSGRRCEGGRRGRRADGLLGESQNHSGMSFSLSPLPLPPSSPSLSVPPSPSVPEHVLK